MKRTHGLSRSREYNSWRGMCERCCNPNQESYSYYGGAGIKVCARWARPHGFVQFLADMGHRPPGTSIDRINPSGNYEPSNCRWASSSVQYHNTVLPRSVTIERFLGAGRAARGKRQALRLWARFGCVFTADDFEAIALGIAEELQEAFGPPRGLSLRPHDLQLDTSDDSEDPFRRMDVVDWEAA